jgi:nitrite reductase (NO-forming)
VRILFGLVWLADAWFKWQPDFINKFTDYLTETLKDQPAAVQGWLHFWVNVINVNPHAFAYIVAVGETAIALGLIIGVFSNLTNVGGALLALVIWSTAEGFGGPYQAGSTDVGAAIIYALVHAVLLLTRAGNSVGLDRWLTPKLGGWGILATGPLTQTAVFI